jgi:hypothetical protein
MPTSITSARIARGCEAEVEPAQVEGIEHGHVRIVPAVRRFHWRFARRLKHDMPDLWKHRRRFPRDRRIVEGALGKPLLASTIGGNCDQALVGAEELRGRRHD